MAIVGRSVSQRRLRDLAPRALQIVERHKSAHFGVDVAAMTVVPAAEGYIKAYDEATSHRMAQNERMAQGRQALAELLDHLRSSQALLNNLLPDFDTRELQGSVETPERLVSDGLKVLQVLSHAGHLPQSSRVIAIVQAAVEKADAQWEQAQAARVALQQGQAVVREYAIALNRELVALRRILRVVVGKSHLDYQALRISRRGSAIDSEDSVVEEEVAQPMTQNGEGAAVTQAVSLNGHTAVFAAGMAAY